MDDFTRTLVIKALADKDSFAKALAHYMFREIVEDIHSEGKITDEEMDLLNREACNRAGLFGDYIMKDENLMKAFLIESNMASYFDPPVMTEDLEKRKALYDEIAEDLEKRGDIYQKVLDRL